MAPNINSFMNSKWKRIVILIRMYRIHDEKPTAFIHKNRIFILTISVICNLQVERLQMVTEQNVSYPLVTIQNLMHPFGHRTKFPVPLVTKLNFTYPFNVPLQSQNKISRTPLVTEQKYTLPFGYRTKLHAPLCIRIKLKYPMSSSAKIHIPLGLRMGHQEPLDLKSGTSITYVLRIKLHVHLATRLKLHTPSSDSFRIWTACHRAFKYNKIHKIFRYERSVFIPCLENLCNIGVQMLLRILRPVF